VVEELDVLCRENITQVAKDVYSMCQTSYDLVQQQVNSGLNVARETLRQKGGARLSGESVSWNAVNQITKASTTVTLPKMMWEASGWASSAMRRRECLWSTMSSGRSAGPAPSFSV